MKFSLLTFLSILIASSPGFGSSNRVLLLEAAAKLQRSDHDLQVISRFYGLIPDEKVCSSATADSNLFIDTTGLPYPCAVISEHLLESYDSAQVDLLKHYVAQGGVLLVNDILDVAAAGGFMKLKYLTDGRVLGGSRRGERGRYLAFAVDDPALTDALTGQTITDSWNAGQLSDQALDLIADTSIHGVISSKDSTSRPFCLFARCSYGSGSLYVSSVYQYHTINQLDPFFNSTFAAEIVPTMMVLKYVYADRIWRASGRFANFTIDDQALADIPQKLDYQAILNEMKKHPFHLTIAYIPQKYVLVQDTPDIEQLFVHNTDYFSTVQHGDFHYLYEFFGYTSEDSLALCLSYPVNCGFPPVSLKRQEFLIVDGLNKLNLMEHNLGLPLSRVMVFPQGISPEPTLNLLEKYNYDASVNAEKAPLLSGADTAEDAWMQPANSDFGGLALLSRLHPYEFSDVHHSGSNFSWGALGMFIGRPALYYSHIGQSIPPASGFNAIADSLNDLAFPPQWKGLDYIATHLYLSKPDGNGSDSVKVFGNKVFVKGVNTITKVLHVFKEENGSPALSEVRLNGNPWTFVNTNGYAYVDVPIGGGSSDTLEFFHESGSVDFAISRNDVSFSDGGIELTIHNLGDSTGCTTAILKDTSSGALFGLTPAVIIEGHASAHVHFNFIPSAVTGYELVVNPFQIGPEVDFANNVLKFSNLPPKQPLRKISTFNLLNNTPNPFNPTTLIRYELFQPAFVNIVVYNSLGENVRTLENEMEEPGDKTVLMDARNLPSGIYFYRLTAGSASTIGKMVLLK